ncbi:N-6 DNA methylase [Saccharomonospora iraqiensis]|uniref:N-6 DNA methylase n=1 Tax=Saccharomonospora iraqiensis TaxID=52698 RepID=UPI00022E0E43|nr:N-6 DNA methylase [Saccharomonospora iraqiensis]
MSESLVTAAEIARMAGVGRAAVSNWRRRHTDFPEPVVGSGANPAFRLPEVEQWLRAQGKLAADSSEDALWRVLEAHRGEADPTELVTTVTAYLRDPDTAEPPREPRIREAVDGLADDASPTELVEQLCTWLFERQQRQHLVTPPELAELMIELAAPVGTTVLDPACGAGNLLHAATRAGADTVFGQEIDPTLARLADARLGLHADGGVRGGDALRADGYPDLRADTVVCDPPFGYRDWGHEQLGLDPRWEYGFPVKGEPELAWVQHCLAHARPGGTAVLALPAGVAARRPGRAIRQALLRRGAVRAVVALPAGVLMSTGIAIHLWVLKNPDAGGAGPVLLVDTGHHAPRRRGRVDWAALSEDVLGAWREFRDTGTVSEVAGRRMSVEPIDLLDEDVDLTPARHLPQPRSELDAAELDGTRRELGRALADLGRSLPAVTAGTEEARATTTVHDLARAQAVVLRSWSGTLETDDTADARGPRVLTGRDVAAGAEPTARLAPTEQEDPVRLVPGDLVVPLLAAGDGRPRARVVDTDDLVLGPNLQLIRVDPEQLDVHFLAGQLRAGGNARARSTTTSGVHRLDVRRIEIPVLPLERQRRLGAVFRQLAEFDATLHHLTATADTLTRQLTDGLAWGVLAPGE